MRPFILFFELIVFCALVKAPVYSQSGDQIQDGSGETGLNARYKFPETTPQLYNQFLTSVPDIQLETVVGNLPGLPRYIKGVYRSNFTGPDVRVLWPAPEDNRQVITPGTYTITGRVTGTDLHPKAIITVREAAAPVTPNRNTGSLQS